MTWLCESHFFMAKPATASEHRRGLSAKDLATGVQAFSRGCVKASRSWQTLGWLIYGLLQLSMCMQRYKNAGYNHSP
jgi:hypothetical protein